MKKYLVFVGLLGIIALQTGCVAKTVKIDKITTEKEVERPKITTEVSTKPEDTQSDTQTEDTEESATTIKYKGDLLKDLVEYATSKKTVILSETLSTSTINDSETDSETNLYSWDLENNINIIETSATTQASRWVESEDTQKEDKENKKLSEDISIEYTEDEKTAELHLEKSDKKWKELEGQALKLEFDKSLELIYADLIPIDKKSEGTQIQDYYYFEHTKELTETDKIAGISDGKPKEQQTIYILNNIDDKFIPLSIINIIVFEKDNKEYKQQETYQFQYGEPVEMPKKYTKVELKTKEDTEEITYEEAKTTESEKKSKKKEKTTESKKKSKKTEKTTEAKKSKKKS